MRATRRVLLTLAAVGLVAGGSATWACFMRSLQPVQVWLDHIQCEINDQVAVKTYDCTFKNPNPVVITDAECFMELEPGAHVDNMRVEVDGKVMQAEILPVDKANEVFNDIVKRGGSPALLEYYGNQLIRTKVPRIAANGLVKVKLTYTTVLENRGGVVRLQMLNTNPKASMQALKSASVNVKITSKQPIKNIYSPTHPIKIGEAEDCDVMVSWSEENYLPKHPLVLYYQIAEDEVGASLLAHREFGEDGHFMLMLSPTIGSGAGAVTEQQILPKDVVFCVDTSGSMLTDNRMEKARAALKYCVENLRKGDRFNIVDFSTGVRVFQENELLDVNEENLAKAQRYIARLAPRGGTAIQDALDESLDLLKSEGRLKMILFTTDGYPTIGERQPQSILNNVAKANEQDVRIFVFGDGFDVNTKLLDFLALNHRGEADYVLPDEDLAKKIETFYNRVGSPVMTDLEISFEGLDVEDVYPPQIADIYRGEQVIVSGVYDGSGEQKVILKGNIGGEVKTLEYTLDFPEFSEDDKNAFVPRLWAGKKVDFLLNEIRKGGMEDQELVDEVTHLAKRYGIVTPYTSFLMAEDIVTQNQQAFGQAALGGFRRALAPQGGGGLAGPGAAQPAADADDRAAAVTTAKESAEARKNRDRSGGASALYADAEKALREAGRGGDGSALAAIRYIGSRTFYKSGKDWYESEYAPDEVKELTTVKVRSDKYFELLKEDSRLAKYLSLGDVVLKFRGRWYRFEN